MYSCWCVYVVNIRGREVQVIVADDASSSQKFTHTHREANDRPSGGIERRDGLIRECPSLSSAANLLSPPATQRAWHATQDWHLKYWVIDTVSLGDSVSVWQCVHLLVQPSELLIQCPLNVRALCAFMCASMTFLSVWSVTIRAMELLILHTWSQTTYRFLETRHLHASQVKPACFRFTGRD